MADVRAKRSFESTQRATIGAKVQVNPKAETVLEDGQYPAVVESIESVETKFGERLIWKFTVTADGEELEKVGFTSLSQSVKSNLVGWAKAILGNIDDGFDTDDIAGKSCVVVLEESEDSDGNPKNKVTKVKPARKDQKAPKQAAAEENEADFEDIPF